VPTPWLINRSRTVLELLDRRAERAPDDAFLTVSGVPITASGAADQSRAVASALTGTYDLSQGDRVALLCENSVETVVSLLGAFRAGCIVVPINSAYKGQFLAHVLADSGAQVVICQRSLIHRLAEIVDLGMVANTVVVVGDNTHATDTDTVHQLETAGLRVVVWEDFLSERVSGRECNVSPEDLAICLYTGGTTGPSKGCMLSHNALTHHSHVVQESYGRTPDDVLWTPLPLFHLNAIKFGLIGALQAEGRSAISDKFSVSRFWTQISDSGATIANLLGSMATLVARSETVPLDDTLRLIVAVPMPEATRRQLEQRFKTATFSGMYGMTECSTISLLAPSDEHRADSAGRVNVEDYDVRIVDEGGDEVAAGLDGEIIVRPRKGNIMFSGYWGRPLDTIEATRDMWFRTGDIGRVDEDSYLWFVDRKGDYLRRRGENISSFEVERILIEHPGIADVAVHAVPSDLTEDDVKVTAVRADPTLSEEDFFHWMVPRLPYFALPAIVEFRAELPRSALGRVLKRELRGEGVGPGCWRSGSAMEGVTRR
jgi:crotonobetaine/carnitine-CoA ligase